MKYSLLNSKAIVASIALAGVCSTQAADFQYTGYYRTGMGTSLQGGTQQCYKLAGARSGYRLGNECETYFEAGMKGEVYNKNDRSFQIQTMIFGVDNDRTNSGDIGLKQAAVMGENVIDSLPGATIWVGKRFYQRHQAHLYNFFYLNTANGNGGGGIENISLGDNMKLSVAWMENDTTNTQDVDGNDLTESTIVHNNTLDVRVAGVGIAGGKLELIGLFSFPSLTEEQEDMDLADNNGTMLMTSYDFGGIEDGYNKFVIQYGKDGMSNTKDGLNDNRLEGTMLRVFNHGLFNISDTSEAQYMVLHETVTDADDNEKTWISAGIRPIFHWNDVASTAIEIGYDAVSSDTQDEDLDLTKITVAQQWSAGDSYFSRPSIRAFVTHAFGSEGQYFREGETSGTSIGMQAEIWF